MPCGAWTQAPCRVAPGLQAPYRVAPGLPRRPHRRSLALTRSTRHTARRQRSSATRDGASLLPGPKRHTGWRLAPFSILIPVINKNLFEYRKICRMKTFQPIYLLNVSLPPYVPSFRRRDAARRCGIAPPKLLPTWTLHLP